MTDHKLYLVPEPLEPPCAPTVATVALTDVLGASFANVVLGEKELFLAVASHIDAEFVFAFGPYDGNHAVSISEHMVDRTIAIVHDTSPAGAAERQLRGQHILHTLKPEAVAKTDVLTHVDRLHGKDARFEYAPWLGACDLVLVDASSAYDYVKCDSLTAYHLSKPGGVVLWNNYDRARGVTRCLNELQRSYRCFRNLRRIADTHICYWRNL